LHERTSYAKGARGNAKSVKVGDTFGRWTVIGSFVRRDDGQAVFPCRCSCGTERGVPFRTLREAAAGKVGGSCGCFQREVMSQKRKHGMGPKDPGYHRARYLWTTYRITPEEFRGMLEEQDHTCAICPSPVDEETGRLDHDHESSLRRGILCHHCNVGLGHFQDNPELLMRAVEYLRLHSSAGERR
jgi:hypothetical protein